MTHEPIKLVCESCGSDELKFDAYAVWSERGQDFELSQTFDAAFCEGCGEYDPAVLEVPLGPAEPA